MTTRKLSTNKSPVLNRRQASVLAMIFMSGTAVATPSPLNLAQKPLFLGGTDPNVLFILDDSGSMNFAFMPEIIGKYALTDPNNSGSACLGENAMPRRLTSAHYNTLYYDPTVIYSPPMNADGSTKADSSFTAAWKDGFKTSDGTTDLRSGYRALFSPGTYSTAGTKCNYLDSTAKAAYYHVFNASNTGCSINTTVTPPLSNDSCYTRVTVGASEQQNFANWFSYYRMRLMTAKTGVSRAFAQATSALYLGYGSINTSGTIARGVLPFKDGVPTSTNTSRTQFFNWLFAATTNGSTPLRPALEDAGKYYETQAAPWSSTPWDTAIGNPVSCRQSYTILMTDGYWNGGGAAGSAKNDNDGTAGTTITPAAGTSPSAYTYTPSAPFRDTPTGTRSDTLADVAMYYWKRDLRTTTDMPNNVPIGLNSTDNAFWQHMTTFTIGLGFSSSVDPVRAFNSITAKSGDTDYGYPTNFAINPATPTVKGWPAPAADSENNIDDLLHAGVNGHGGFYSAASPSLFAQALNKTLDDIGNRSASASSVSMNSARLSTDSMVYQASFKSGGWTGDVIGYTINPSTQALTELAKASNGLPAPSARKIYTWNPATSSGVLFQWGNLTTTANTGQQARITAGITAALGAGSISGSELVDYVRGDKSKEKTNGGSLRNRSSVLGDITNSDPAYAGKEDFGYGSATSIPAAQRSSYAAFIAAQVPMLYVGANDGMLHAFDGSSTAGSALKEIFAYVPNNVLDNLPWLAKATDFSHKYFVDGPITVGHAYLSGGWKTVLVGATGAGGKTYFALDVTTPSSPTVLWEYTHAELGNTLGKAAITRMPDGTWAAIFGNGYNSTSGNAALFIVNLQTGALMTGSNPLTVASRDTTLANGLATPIEADANRDGSTDVVYAGDLQGSMWKFNLSSVTNSTWAVSFGGKPLFQTPSKTAGTVTSYPQAITSQPQVARHPLGGAMVFFGSGKFFETADQSNTSLQTYYGVRDECLLNTGTGCGSLSAPKVTPSQLLAQTFTESLVSGNTIRTMSKNKDMTKMGWYVNLQVAGSSTATGERVIANGLLLDDRIIFTSIIPNEDVCGFGGDSWLFELDLFTGGATDFSVFDLNNDGLFDAADKGNARKISGLVKTPSISAKDEKTGYTFTGTSDPALRVDRINLNRTIGRQTWRQVR